MTRTLALALAVTLGATPALTDSFATHELNESFDDATFALESEIVAHGLVIDLVSHVGPMLARTKEDVGGTVDLFDDARIYIFCSATVSRAVMEADPMNLRHCPYGIHLYSVADGGAVTVGHVVYADDSMAPVNDLLAGIVAGAFALD